MSGLPPVTPVGHSLGICGNTFGAQGVGAPANLLDTPQSAPAVEVASISDVSNQSTVIANAFKNRSVATMSEFLLTGEVDSGYAGCSTPASAKARSRSSSCASTSLLSSDGFRGKLQESTEIRRTQVLFWQMFNTVCSSGLDSEAAVSAMQELLALNGAKKLLAKLEQVSDLSFGVAAQIPSEAILAEFGNVFQEIAQILATVKNEVHGHWFFRREMNAIAAKAIELGTFFGEAFVLAKVPGPNASVTASFADWSKEWLSLGPERQKEFLHALRAKKYANSGTPSTVEASLEDETLHFFIDVLSAATKSASEDAVRRMESSSATTAQSPVEKALLKALKKRIENFNTHFSILIRSFKPIDSLFVVLLPMIGLLAWQVSIVAASLLAAVIVIVRVSIWLHVHHYRPKMETASKKMDEKSKALNYFLESKALGFTDITNGRNVIKLLEENQQLQQKLDDQSKRIDELTQEVKKSQEEMTRRQDTLIQTLHEMQSMFLSGAQPS